MRSVYVPVQGPRLLKGTLNVQRNSKQHPRQRPLQRNALGEHIPLVFHRHEHVDDEGQGWDHDQDARYRCKRLQPLWNGRGHQVVRTGCRVKGHYRPKVQVPDFVAVERVA